MRPRSSILARFCLRPQQYYHRRWLFQILGLGESSAQGRHGDQLQSTGRTETQAKTASKTDRARFGDEKFGRARGLAVGGGAFGYLVERKRGLQIDGNPAANGVRVDDGRSRVEAVTRSEFLAATSCLQFLRAEVSSTAAAVRSADWRPMTARPLGRRFAQSSAEQNRSFYRALAALSFPSVLVPVTSLTAVRLPSWR
uniref:Uncharacterized protein n=1 Tax=Plectus sambesii TaxID=2011161 RepID=A0A914XJF1_9BILA